jgi:hypothetical protein
MFRLFRRKPLLTPPEDRAAVVDEATHEPPESEWREAVTMATDRVQLIIDAAERVAAGIRDDAENQARRYVDDARRRAEELTSDRIRLISQTSDSLLEQARAVKAQSEELLSALQAAAAKITAAASDVSPTIEPTNESSPGPTEWPPEGDSPPPPPEQVEGARANGDPWLLATQMAVAGADLAEIEERLREVGVEDPRPILDRVLSDT